MNSLQEYLQKFHKKHLQSKNQQQIQKLQKSPQKSQQKNQQSIQLSKNLPENFIFNFNCNFYTGYLNSKSSFLKKANLTKILKKTSKKTSKKLINKISKKNFNKITNKYLSAVSLSKTAENTNKYTKINIAETKDYNTIKSEDENIPQTKIKVSIKQSNYFGFLKFNFPSLSIIALALCLNLTGCQTFRIVDKNVKSIDKDISKPKSEVFSKGVWEGKATIKDIANGGSHFVSLDVYAKDSDLLRIEVSALLGIHVASMLVKGPETFILSTREGRFYKGTTSPELFEKLVDVPLSPKILMGLLFKGEVLDENWNCSGPKSKFKCFHKNKPLNLDWKKQSLNESKILFASPNASLDMVLHFKPDKDFDETHIANLVVPKNFKSYRVKD